ncbi:hypothetical protein LINPERHAP2_LOCUS19107 [Linum perenne]
MPTLPRRRPCLLETVIEAEKQAAKDLILEKRKDREADLLKEEEEEEKEEADPGALKKKKIQEDLVRIRIPGVPICAVEDLNLKAVESLQGIHYLAIGKHLCGPATDLTLKCFLPERYSNDATEETDKEFMFSLGISKEEFHAITWFTSWAVNGDHGAEVSDSGLHLELAYFSSSSSSSSPQLPGKRAATGH